MSGEVDSALPIAELEAPGRSLAQLRQARGVTVADVADRLKYAARQIEALEADDYARLPGATFVRGMVRSYARLLEADSAPLVRSLEARLAPAQARIDLSVERIPFPDGSRRASRIYVGLALAAVGAAALIFYEWRTSSPELRRPQESPVLARPVPAPAVVLAESVPSLPASADAGEVRIVTDSRRLQLEFQKESWVEIKDRDGHVLLSQLNSAGSRAAVEGVPPFAVVIGNAANVRLIYNDVPVDLRPHVKIEVARLTLE